MEVALVPRSFTPIITLFVCACLLLTQGCANIRHSAKSAPSLTSFLGFSELPDWYLTSRYSYPDSQWIYNDFGQHLHYRDVGEGPVILMLHQELSSSHMWEAWIEALRGDYRIIALDLPGSGLTGPTHCLTELKQSCPSNLSLNYLEHTLEYFIEDLKISNINIIGSGLGAYLAMGYSQKHPNRVAKLALLNPLGFKQTLPSSAGYMTTASFIARFVQPAPSITALLRQFYAQPEQHEASIKRAADLAQAQGSHHSNTIQIQMVTNLMNEGTAENFTKLATKGLILWGQQDSWGDPSHSSQWQTLLTEAQVVNYPALGRLLNEEQAELTVADVQAFLKGEALPSIEGLGTEGSFTLEDAANQFDKTAIFGEFEAPKQGDTSGSKSEPLDAP